MTPVFKLTLVNGGQVLHDFTMTEYPPFVELGSPALEHYVELYELDDPCGGTVLVELVIADDIDKNLWENSDGLGDFMRVYDRWQNLTHDERTCIEYIFKVKDDMGLLEQAVDAFEMI